MECENRKCKSKQDELFTRTKFGGGPQDETWLCHGCFNEAHGEFEVQERNPESEPQSEPTQEELI